MTTQESFMKEAQISFPLIEFVNHVSSRPDTPHQRMTNIQQEGSQPERYKIFPAKKLLGNLQREAGLKKYANETLKFQQIKISVEVFARAKVSHNSLASAGSDSNNCNSFTGNYRRRA